MTTLWQEKSAVIEDHTSPNSAAGDGVSDVVIPSDNALSLKHNEVFRLLYA